MLDQLSLTEIAARLHSEAQSPPENFSTPVAQLTEAAVLILLVCQDEHWHLVLTRRTQTVRDHKGQVAFPGGAWEEDDASLEMTALRETQEEIGLDPAKIQILGQLNPVSTISSYRITPFVGTCTWPQELHPAVDEVERVFVMPLEWLAIRENWYTREFIHPETGIKRQAVIYTDYDGEMLWGISATLVHHLLQRLQNPNIKISSAGFSPQNGELI